MEWWLVLLVFFGGLTLLMAVGLPVAFALGALSMGTMFLLWGGAKGMGLLAHMSFTTSQGFVLGAFPGFVFMAEMLVISGVTDRAVVAVNRLFGRARGGVAYGTIVISAIFAAVTGLSVAACVAIGAVAIPRMLRLGYSKDVAVGVVGGGATLAILIPPSIPMIMYAFLAEVSVGKMFMAGIIPGLVTTVLYLMYVAFRSIADPQALPRGAEIASMRDRVLGLAHLSPFGFLIFLVLGTIYLGVATPTEAAAIGSAGALLLAIVYRKLTWAALRTAVWNTAMIGGMIYIVIIGAINYKSILIFTGATTKLSQFAVELLPSPLGIVIAAQVLVLLLGMFLGPMALLFILVPVFIPIVNMMGINPIWFGILFVINAEIAFETPPIGGNLFALRAISPPEVSWRNIILGVAPFIILDLMALILVLVFPSLALWLPEQMVR